MNKTPEDRLQQYPEDFLRQCDWWGHQAKTAWSWGQRGTESTLPACHCAICICCWTCLRSSTFYLHV